MPQKYHTAIILAGGQSSRMGTDKGLMLFQGRPMVTFVLNVLQNLEFREILIITPNTLYKQFGYPCYQDVVQNKGPLGGIYAGLNHSTRRKNLVLACDMPFITEDLITALMNESDDEDVLLTQHNGKAEPLCSVYDLRCMEHIKERLDKDQLKITEALRDLYTRTICFDNSPWFRGNEFSNLNTLEDLTKQQQ